MPLSNMKLPPKPVVLSLFCGAGGLDLGFERQGFEVGLAFDVRSDSIDSYNKNRNRKSGYVRDIRELDLKTLDQLYGSSFSPIGVIGGPPCQGFSVSNVRQQKSDSRNSLSFVYANLLGELNARNPVHFFVFENVKGLIGSKHRPTYEKIKNAFRKSGFDLHVATLNAVDFGAPQKRERLVIVGLNSLIYANVGWSAPEVVVTDRCRSITVRSAISGLPDPVYFSNVTDKSKIPHHPNHWCMTPRSPKFRKGGALREGQSYGRSFRTLVWDKPSPTVAYGNREVHVHPSGLRRLSVYEAMLLQGFPRDYELTGNLSQQITQISEAVPPPLAEVVARSLIEQLGLRRVMQNGR